MLLKSVSCCLFVFVDKILCCFKIQVFLKSCRKLFICVPCACNLQVVGSDCVNLQVTCKMVVV